MASCGSSTSTASSWVSLSEHHARDLPGMASEYLKRYGQRRQHFEEYHSDGKQRGRAWTGAYLHGHKGIKKGCSMLTWAGQNFPNWTPSNRTKPELRLSTYNQFRLLVLETYADQVEESMDEVIAQLQASVLRERKACKKTFGRLLDPVHKPIHRQLATQDVQLRAQKNSPAEAAQQQGSAEAVQQATNRQHIGDHEHLKDLQGVVQQQGETMRLHSAKISKLEDELALCKRRKRKNIA